MMKTLLMFSGGIDSTGVFWKLLQSDEKIHVHHMNLINKEKRSDAEKIAVKNICEHMRKIKDFDYSESTHECPSIKNNFMWDSDLYNFMAGSMCLCDKEISHIALGLTKTDLEPERSVKNINGVRERISRGTNILKCFSIKVEKIYPVINMTKKEIYQMLPENLRVLTWSCRTPVYLQDRIMRCGKCKTCLELRSLPNSHNDIILGGNH